MMAQQTRTRRKTRRSWRTLADRHRTRDDAASTLASVIERTATIVHQLERTTGGAALQPLLAGLERARVERAVGVRGSLGELRERMAAIRAVAESGAAVPAETLARVREIESRLHEAHWLARQAARRATATAMDLQRLCVVTSGAGEFIDLLLGLGSQTSELVRGRRIAA